MPTLDHFISNGGSRVGDKCGVLLKNTRARLLFQPKEQSRCADFTSSWVQRIDECLPLFNLSFSIDKQKMKCLSAEGLHFSALVVLGLPCLKTLWNKYTCIHS